MNYIIIIIIYYNHSIIQVLFQCEITSTFEENTDGMINIWKFGQNDCTAYFNSKYSNHLEFI